ncbi:MAG: YeeE/YedE family protein [Pacificibacter sp.]|uniref:YeeE/YedE family protein n=1 Tax=Pacificibacter sp. TaxID=1917866 RepID=UPI00321BA30A
MFDAFDPGVLSALVGCFGGIGLGLAARLGRFCSMGAIEDLLYQGSSLRARQWGVAIGVAIMGVFTLVAFDLFDPAQTAYLTLDWSPISAILGGLMFGYGMALAGNCGFGALARLGGGDLRNFVIVVVMGLSSYVALNGPLAQLRATLFPPHLSETPSGIAHWISDFGLPLAPIGMIIGALILLASLASKAFLRDRAAVIWAAIVGLVIVSGWAGTAWISDATFNAEPITSHSFAAPIGDTMFYLMMSSATSPGFGVGSIAGVLIGAAIGSLIKGHFRWEACDDPRELKRQIGGAALMGIGAVLAFGCTIGQGLSAMSVLAYLAPLTMAAIVAGAAFGLHQLIYGFSSKV